MKFFTPEKAELIEITAVTPHKDGILISGRIMSTMPMKAVLRPDQLRQGFRFMTPRLMLTLLAMLFRRSHK
jgi:hypothetical protein